MFWAVIYSCLSGFFAATIQVWGIVLKSVGWHAGDKETEQLQAVELEKLLQHPAVMQMLAQMASSKGGGGMNPEELQMRQQEAVRFPIPCILLSALASVFL